jgi:hypothetical protein
MSALDQEYKTWLEKNGITRVPTQDDMNAFLEERNLPERVVADVARWKAARPECPMTEFNRTKLNYWLNLNTSPLPATFQNLEEAFEAMKGVLQLVKPVPPLPEVETRVGAWRNGVFHPDPAYNQPSRVTYAQHAETPATVGQSDPGGVAAGEPTIRKNVNNMTADEYLKSINSSRTFQKKMDESKS